jgi:hypothetical protein
MTPELELTLQEFEKRSGLNGIEHDVLARSDGEILRIKIANPSNRFFSILEDVRKEVSAKSESDPRATLVKARKPNPLSSAEGRLLLRTLSESLNVSRHTFGEDFFTRYTKSVFGAESQITADANHIVFGRRGAGKSSLLLYALHTRNREGLQSLWIDMQTYARRADLKVAADVLVEVLSQCSQLNPDLPSSDVLVARLRMLIDAREDLKTPALRALLPDIRRFVQRASSRPGGLVLFLDDFHVLDLRLQPRLLQQIYSVTRGNRVFLKISAIETLTSTWNPQRLEGLQIPHDIQDIKLDYNLTMPEKAVEHISSILDSHAVYCGLPSIKSICMSPGVLSRLVWVAAGVPRDALSVFAQAMTKSSLAGGRLTTVSNVNVAASDLVTTKLRDLEVDASAELVNLNALLNDIRDFCIREERINAFLVEIMPSDWKYQGILKLVDLRVLHVISEGVSIGQAGEKYLGLILDFGFYVGIRAARSVELFNRQTKRVIRSDLRGLPVYKSELDLEKLAAQEGN